jgi:hypothetical protein
MDFHDFVALGKQEPVLRFLVVDGFAVGAHGHGRTTYDFDLMVRCADADAWVARATGLGLTLHSRSEFFAQFFQEEGVGFDLMFANEKSFDELWKASSTHSFEGTEAHVPSLDHLLSLKLHAPRHTMGHRSAKDMEDFEMLVRVNDVPIASTCYEQLFLKYGNHKPMTRSNESCVVRDAALLSLDFELPEIEPLPRHFQRMSLSSFLKINEQTKSLFPKWLPTEEERWGRERHEEFDI